MRFLLKKFLSTALAAVIFLGGLPASASDALGHDLAARSTALDDDVELADGTFWSDSGSDLRRENYVVYTPNTRVTPLVTYGETSRSLTTVSAAARALEARGLRVIAGVNGDYYDTQNGLPIGSTMADGTLRNVSGDPYYAIGFRADGMALIGDPKLSIRVTHGSDSFSVFAFNYIRHSEYGISLYDSGFNARHTTGTSEPGVDVICSVTGGALTIGGTLALRVDEILPEATDTVVPDGKYILTANLKAAGEAAALLALQPGDQLTLSVDSGAENNVEWESVRNLIGAPLLLVENGAVAGGLAAGSAPRTAIGQRRDGTLIFYTIDGRRAGHSIGASLTAVAMRLLELDCVTAVALDGGGSTTLAATMPNETSARVVNTPSEGSERAVSNHVFLVAPSTPSGVPDHIYLAPGAVRALPGAEIALAAAVIDTNGIPMDAPVTFSADGGSVSEGVLVLPAEPGTVAVTASCNGMRVTARVEAMEPESIVLKRDGAAITSLSIAPGGNAALTAEGIVNHLALAGGSNCFTWRYEGDGVTFDAETHTLLAGSSAGAGTLTVSFGGKSTSIPVTVAVVPLKLLSGFEGAFDEYGDGALTLARSTDAAHVHNGRASAMLRLAPDGEAPATLPLHYAVPAGYDCVSFWLYGDGNGTALTVKTDAGPTALFAVSFTGWRRAVLSLPDGACAITGLTLTADMGTVGTLWLDQLMLSYGLRTDDDAPEISLAYDAEAGTLTGRAFDAVDGAALTGLRLTCDGAPLAYNYDSRTGALAATLPTSDGLSHRVTLSAADASGNLARASVELTAEDAEAAFPDTEGHWANDWIAYLKRAGISNGNGGLYYPDANLTRQEFTLMLFRYLAPEEDYGETELPFSDLGQIGPWALDAVKAMYRLGVVTGTPDGDGTLRFNPTAEISRQEAATMIGRLLDKGWPAPELTFPDSGDIPDWAAEHIRVLGALGVLGGYEDGSFCPADPLTRAQIAAMLYRLN